MKKLDEYAVKIGRGEPFFAYYFWRKLYVFIEMANPRSLFWLKVLVAALT